MFKKSVKILLISLLLVFIFNISFCLADPCDPEKDMCYTPEITFPGFDKEIKVTPSLLGNYISALYQYLLYAAGVVAVVVIMIGGFQWITAGGNQSRIGAAKERITSAIIGLFLALGSYLLLFTINPDLIKIVDLSMPSIEPISNYCGEKQTVSLTQDNPTEFGLLPTDHFTGIDGSEARCGFNYSQSIEGNDYKCMGISCKHKGQNFICYNGKCLTPFTACWEEGSKLFKLSEFSMWSGEMKSGWNGEIPMDLPEGIDGACYRYTLFKSNISLKLGDLITGNNELYYYRWAYDKDINETISKIETGGATCESMNLKYVVQYKACQKSSHCTFSRNGMIETACINANAN